MKKLSAYKAELDSVRAKKRAKEEESKKRDAQWVENLRQAEIPPYIDPEDTDEEEEGQSFRTRVRRHIIEELTVRHEVECDHCGTEMVTFSRGGYGRVHDTIACPGCGYHEAWDTLEEQSLKILKNEPPYTLDYQFQTLIQLVALLMSQTQPFVRSIEDGRIVLELPQDQRPFKPFELDKDSLAFRLSQEGDLVTIELEGKPPQQEERAQTWLEQVDEDVEEDPEHPVCLCLRKSGVPRVHPVQGLSR